MFENSHIFAQIFSSETNIVTFLCKLFLQTGMKVYKDQRTVYEYVQMRRLVRAFAGAHATMLEISCRGSYGNLQIIPWRCCRFCEIMFNQRLNLFKINMVSIDPGKMGLANGTGINKLAK